MASSRYSPRSDAETRRRTFRLHPVVDDALDVAADEAGQSVNAVVNEVLYEWALRRNLDHLQTQAAVASTLASSGMPASIGSTLDGSSFNAADASLSLTSSSNEGPRGWLERAITDVPDVWSTITAEVLASQPAPQTPPAASGRYADVLARLSGLGPVHGDGTGGDDTVVGEADGGHGTAVDASPDSDGTAGTG